MGILKDMLNNLTNGALEDASEDYYNSKKTREEKEFGQSGFRGMNSGKYRSLADYAENTVYTEEAEELARNNPGYAEARRKYIESQKRLKGK